MTVVSIGEIPHVIIRHHQPTFLPCLLESHSQSVSVYYNTLLLKFYGWLLLAEKAFLIVILNSQRNSHLATVFIVMSEWCMNEPLPLPPLVPVD